MPYFTRSGRRLFYREEGEGPPLVILPGNTASSACHAGELAHFGQRFRAAALDLGGTGNSERLERFPDDWFEQAAHDAAALVAHLGAGPAVVVGCSGGAIAALLAAALHPEAVRAVIADSTLERFPPGRLAQEVARRNPEDPGAAAFWRLAHGEDWRAVVAADSGFLLRVEAAGGEPFAGRLGQIRCPTLLTASLTDPALPGVGAQAAGMAAQIPGAEVYLVNGGDHPLMWSCPETFRRAADGFLGAVGCFR